jgi:radical SAM protein with 4Fe4S-binding SPASM domain
MAVPLFPKRIHIEPTNLCNQKCHFCPRNEMDRSLGKMPLDLFKKIVADCRGFDIRLWLHFMGEPLLNPALFDMIAHAKEQGVREVGLSTNATYLTDRKAMDLLRTPLDRLEFSIDALDREYFLRMRGVDEFDKVKANMEEFLRQKNSMGGKKPVVTLSFMRTPENNARRQEIIDTWQPLLGKKDFIMMIDEMSFVDFERRGSQDPRYGKRTPCNWLWQYMVILWNGDVSLCASDYDGKEIMGNANEQSLSDIFNGEKFAEFRQRHLQGEYDRIANCAQCDIWKNMEFEGYEYEGYTNILA